jgi:hypothetical protein
LARPFTIPIGDSLRWFELGDMEYDINGQLYLGSL